MIGPVLFGLLSHGIADGVYGGFSLSTYRDYLTREAAFADLRQALRAARGLSLTPACTAPWR